MAIHRTSFTKTLAFGFAGSFFLLVCLMFASLVALGWSSSLGHASSSGQRYVPYQPPPVSVADDPYGGRLVATLDGAQVLLPTVETDYQVDVRGDLVSVQVTQRFENPGDAPLDAEYQFPLHEDAAVYAMTMRVGDEVVRAQIQRREEAQAIYEQAKDEGRAAALTEQQRPNLFTQSVANLMPGLPVEVELRYVHTAERRDGRYHVALPLAVGERFIPADMSGNALVEGSGDNHELSDAAETIDADRVKIAVRIDGGMPVIDVRSRTHPIDIELLGRADARVGLRAGQAIPNRHFELSYGLAGANTQAGLLAEYDPRTQRGYFSLLIEPPAIVSDTNVTPREMVFVLDCSGSMRGQPMDVSKAFMRRALRDLRPTDTFRIIRFSEGATEFSSEPITASTASIEAALEYVDGLNGTGGTHMAAGVEQALNLPVADGTIRLVTFLTDGYIGNDYEVTRLVREQVGEARLFAIGVGTSPNRYVIEEMARAGRGFARYIDPNADIDRTAIELAERLQSPVLTGITLQATDAGFGSVTPTMIPDLFAGQSVRVAGTYTTPGRHKVIVRGSFAGKRVEFPLTVDLPGQPTDGDAVRLTWARAQIADRMHALLTPAQLREGGETSAELEASITQLGLDHALVTQWTSFVATSDTVVNPDAASPPELAFAGGTTPEPGIIGGLLMTLVAAGGAARRRRREDDESADTRRA